MKMQAVVKEMFFDRPKVQNAMDRATRKVLSKFGAFVRRRAKSSIRRRKRISRPGEPPSSHTGLLRSGIYFGYDAGRQSVVIGPTPLRDKTGSVPEILEHGGEMQTSLAFKIRNREKARRRVRIAARPFMRPAYEAELPGLPAMWRDSVK